MRDFLGFGRRTDMAKSPVDFSEDIEKLLASAVMGCDLVELDGVLHIHPEGEQLEIWQPLLNRSQLFRCYSAAREKWDAVAGRDSSYNVAFADALKRFLFRPTSGIRCTVFDDADLANAWAERPFEVGCAILTTCDVEVVL